MNIGYFENIKITKNNITWYLIDIWANELQYLEEYPHEYYIKIIDTKPSVIVAWIHQDLFSMLTLKYAPFETIYDIPPKKNLKDTEVNLRKIYDRS